MYPLTSSQKQLFQSFSRQLIKVVNNQTSAQILTGAEIESLEVDRYTDVNGAKLEIGTAISAQVTITVRNTSGQFSASDFMKKEFTVSVGTADWTQSTPAPFYFPIGIFTIHEVRAEGRKLILVGYDRMTNFDVLFDPNMVSSYPVTVGNLVQTICTNCGVSLAQMSTTPLNWNYQVKRMSFGENITCRMVIQWCAFLMACSAYFDYDAGLKFGWHPMNLPAQAEQRYDTTTANRFSSTIADDEIKITGLRYQNNSNVIKTAGTADYMLEYAGCGILSEGDEATILTSIANAINGFKYYPSTEVTLPAPYIFPFDPMTYTDADGNTYRTVCTHVIYKANQNMSFSGDGLTIKAADTTPTRGTAVAIQQASEEATKYITTITGKNGVCVHNAEDYDNYLNLNGTTLDVYVDNAKKASYGEDVILGNDGESHVTISDTGLDVYTTASTLVIPYEIDHVLHIGDDGTAGSVPVPSENPACFKYGILPSTLPTMGAFSAAFNGEATGTYAFSAGGTASGTKSASFGNGTASGDRSFAAAQATASSTNQVAIGKHNVIDSSGTYAFIIGNGTEEATPSGTVITRSNAFTVDWNGKAEATRFVASGIGTGSDAGIVLTANGNACISAGRSDNDWRVDVAVGTQNRGLFDRTTTANGGINDWIIKLDSSNHVVVPNLYIGSDQVHVLKYYDETSTTNYTIGSSTHYAAITRPTAVSGKTLVGITVLAWTSNSGAFSIMPYSASNSANSYLVGASGVTVNGLKLRWWYID